MKISAIIITRNEEDSIKDCIETLKFVDEVIVIDNNSKDKTVSILKSLGVKTYQVKGLDFSYLRNYGKEKADSDWLFYIDADERVSKGLAKEILEVLNNPKDFSAFSLKRVNYFFGKKWPKTEKMVRLIKKQNLLGWQGALHETPLVAGKIGDLESQLIHFTHDDLSLMVDKTNEWSEIEARLRYKSNHPGVSWWRFFRVMFTAFWQSYIKQGGWKVSTIGLVESLYQAFSIFITYAKLWEKQSRITKNQEQ